jgi:hypothetical protein
MKNRKYGCFPLQEEQTDLKKSVLQLNFLSAKIDYSLFVISTFSLNDLLLYDSKKR